MRFTLYNANEYQNRNFVDKEGFPSFEEITLDALEKWQSRKEKLPSVEVNTLDDLERLQSRYEARLIVDFENKEIVVYDDYVE